LSVRLYHQVADALRMETSKSVRGESGGGKSESKSGWYLTVRGLPTNSTLAHHQKLGFVWVLQNVCCTIKVLTIRKVQSTIVMGYLYKLLIPGFQQKWACGVAVSCAAVSLCQSLCTPSSCAAVSLRESPCSGFNPAPSHFFGQFFFSLFSYSEFFCCK